MEIKEKKIFKKIKLRPITLKDYDSITALQLKCFPGMKPWTKEQFSNIITIFPEGQSCIVYEKKIIASSCSLIIDFNNYTETSTWSELTDSGNINNHTLKGDTLYGMEIMVDPEYRGMKLSRRLYDARKNLAKHYNLKRILIGGRLPNYHKYQKKIDINGYIESVMEKRVYDPVLTAQLANGFALKRILPEYLPNDKESCGYATLLEWTNFHYKNQNTNNQINYSPYVRVSAVQYQMRSISAFADFAKQCEYFVDAASDYKSDFVVFPEMLTMQLLSFLTDKRPSVAVRELNNYTQQYIDLFCSLAIKYNVNIIGGSHFCMEEDSLYNISFLFRRDGSYDKQYKIHITPYETKWWGVKGGDKVQVFDTDKGKIAILICYDIEFPELARIAVSKGAKILFVPFNTDDRRAYLRVRYCAQARAIENQIYVVITGCVGNLPEVDNLDIHFSQTRCFMKKNLLLTKLFIFLAFLSGIVGKASNYISDGYMGQISYNLGDTGSVFINANANSTNTKLYLYNVNNKIVDSVITNLYSQSISAANIAAPWQKGFGYLVSFKYLIKNNLPSGIYNWEGKIFFIVKSASKNADITIIYPSNTEAAYNNSGGKCFYHNSSTNNVQGDTLSFLRPLTAIGLSYYRMYSDPIMKWLNTLNGYSIQVICDQDLDDYTEIQNSKIICVVGHSEYWTRTARLNFDQFVNSGKDAVILSGNTMCWQVRYHSTDKTRIVCYKNLADPISNPLLKTIFWTDPSLNYSVNKSIGVDWLHGAYPPSTTPGAYHGWAGYKIMLPTSPLLAGTGLNFNDTLSCKTREYDGTIFNGVDGQGDPILDTTSLGFCKIELIGYDYGEEDQQSSPVKGYGTFIAFKKTSTSGNIINVASTQWCANTSAFGYPGGFGGADSGKIQQIILNMFNLLLTNSNMYSAPAPNCLPKTSVCCNQQNIDFKIFPNPSNGIFFIQRENADTVRYSLSVYNVMGEKCIHNRVMNVLDLSNQPNGIYFINIETEQGVIVRKLIISH